MSAEFDSAIDDYDARRRADIRISRQHVRAFADRGALVPFIAATLAALATALPILAHPYLPLVDLPNHVARLHVAASDLQHGPLAPYYDYVLTLTPNSAADLAWRVLGYPGSPARFAQALMAVYAVNLIAAAMVLGRVLHGRWTAWPAAAGMLAYSAPFLWGFQNFVFSLPFVLYGLALWIGTERRSDLLRVVIMLPFAILLYLMHFFGFAILAIAVFGREAQVALTASGAPARRLGVFILRMMPFALPVAWLAWGILTGPSSPVPSITRYGTFWHTLNGLVSPFVSYVLGGALLDGAGLLGAGILIAVILFALSGRHKDVIALDSRLTGSVIALALAAAFAPFWLNGVAWVQIRVPVALALVIVAGLRFGPLAPRLAGLLALAVGLVIVGRGIALERHAAAHSADVADLVALGEALPPRARVLAVRAPELRRDSRFSHVQAYLVAVVPEARLELASLAAEDFESPASTIPPLGPEKPRRCIASPTGAVNRGLGQRLGSAKVSQSASRPCGSRGRTTRIRCSRRCRA
jgi:hypothetical protein